MKKFLVHLMAIIFALTSFSFVPLIADAENTESISITDVGNEYFEQSISMYEDVETEFSDPQVEGYTDEDFFGVYDGDEWTTPSLLNYEDFPALSAVEEAAKSGDYETAKVEIQKYYRDKFAGTSFNKGKSVNNSTLNSSLLFLENAFSSNKVLGFMKLTRDIQTIDINVREAVVSASDTSSKRMGLIFTGIRKDGNLGIIYSKESEYVPVMTVTVNGRAKEYTPLVDTYVAPGDYLMDNFGSEPVLMVSESYSSIGTPNVKVDSYTNRAYMMFDLSDISANDTVNNAVLTVSGNSIESQCPEKPDSIPEYTDVAVHYTQNINYEEDTLNWYDFASGFTSASGEYSLGIDNILTISNSFGNPLAAYNATGEEAYAYAATRVVTGAIRFLFTDQYINYREQNTLATSQFVSDFSWFVGDMSQYPEHILTPEKFTLILKFVYATTQEVVTDWSSNEEGGNWGVVNACAVAISAMAFPEFAVADDELIPPSGTSLPGRALGGWKEVGNYRIMYTAKKCLFDDGSCTDTSYAYTKYIVNQYSRFFNVAGALEIDVHKVLSEETLDLFEQYLMFLLSASNPIKGGWQQGDCHISDGQSNAVAYYKSIISVLNNPNLNWAINMGYNEEEPDFLSKAYDTGGKLTLRSGWDKNALGAFINADGSGMVHAHNDDLSLSVFAYGKMLLADPCQPNYDTNQPITNLLYSTRAHNTVEINGVNASGQGQSMTFTNAEGEEETIIGSAGGGGLGSLHPENREFNRMYNFIQTQTLGYTGNRAVDENFEQFREVLMISPEYLIVTDRITPDGLDGEDDENTYSQYWHTVNDANMVVDSETGVAQTNFELGANITIAPVKGESPMSASKHFSWYETANTFADFVRYDTTASGPLALNTVLYPTPSGSDVKISTQLLSTDLRDNEASALTFKVIDENTSAEKEVYYYSLHDITKKGQQTFGKYTTDATLSLVQTVNELYDKLVLRNGTFVSTIEGKSLVKSDSNISELGIRWNDDEIILDSSKFFVEKSFVGTEAENVNLALGKNGVSSLHFENTKVANAFDGNPDTVWSAAIVEGEEELAYLALNLESEQEISKIRVRDNNSAIKYTISYLAEDGEWVEIQPTNTYKDPFGTDSNVVKNYLFEPVVTRYIKIQANEIANLQIAEMEVYSGLANAISLYDLSIYAPGNVRSVTVNGVNVSVYRDGDYIVFSEELAGDTPSTDIGGNGSSNDKVHGNGPSPGCGGGGGGSSSDNDEPKKDNSEKDENKDTVYDYEIKGHWGETEIRDMITKGIVNGDGKSLNLKNPVTRAEFTALLVRALGIEEKDYQDEFSDVSGDEWYADTLAAATEKGLLQGSDGKAMPDGLLTREQMAKMLVSAYLYLHPEADINETVTGFADNGEISEWAKAFVAQSVEIGLMNGMGDGRFAPSETALREQAFAAVHRLLNK